MLEWNGKQVDEKIVEAIKRGVNQTMSACAIHAKNNHPWRNRTGVAEGSIRPVVAAHEQKNQIAGVWGSVDVDYFVYLELGTRNIAALPSLRPAADAEYPKLTERIRKNLGRNNKEQT